MNPSSMLRKLQELSTPDGYLTYAQFVECALYDPLHGYYTSNRNRVGRTPETDFYTSSSLGPLFGRLVAEAALGLLGDAATPSSLAFIEIGAEPGCSVLDGVEHPFAETRTLRVGDRLEVTGNAVVFANEWLDAQPFHRLVLENGKWRETGLSINDGGLSEIRLPQVSDSARPYAARLPEDLPEGYRVDVPSGACEALQGLVAQPWKGLFLTLDYGKSLAEMTETIPQGTARAYRNHQQSDDLAANPGEQDLTCHVCWDWLEDILAGNGFRNVNTLRQESLFMRHASRTIQETLEDDSKEHIAGKGRLKELLHPAHLGFKFQALSGLRELKT